MSKIELNDVSVSYITGDFSTVGLKDVVIQKIKRQYKPKEFTAVKNVSFSLEEGELLGIVGSNGASFANTPPHTVSQQCTQMFCQIFPVFLMIRFI